MLVTPEGLGAGGIGDRERSRWLPKQCSAAPSRSPRSGYVRGDGGGIAGLKGGGAIVLPSKSALEKLGTGGEIAKRNSSYEELTLPSYVSSCLIQRGSACPLICEC